MEQESRFVVCLILETNVFQAATILVTVLQCMSMCVCVCRPINPFLRKGLITFKGESVTRRRLTDNSRKRDRHVESPRHTIIHHHRHLPTSAANSITRNNATVNLHTLRLYHTSNKASQVWLRTQGREGAEKNNRSAAAVCGRWEIIFSAELLLPHKGCMCMCVCVCVLCKSNEPS